MSVMKTADFEAVKNAQRIARSRFEHYSSMVKAKPVTPEKNEANTQRQAANKSQKK